MRTPAESAPGPTRLIWSVEPSGALESLLGNVSARLLVVDAGARRCAAPGLGPFWKRVEKGGPAVARAGGEKTKSWAAVRRLHREAALRGVDRGGRFLAIGGGAVLDVAGFAAGTWLRGVESVYVPTTLLAMVDAAVGGKTAINTPEGKNLAGLFHPPAAVLFSPRFLHGLPRTQVLAGWAEMVKHALLMSREEFRAAAAVADPQEWVRREPDAALAAIRRSVAFKEAVVRRDPRETSGVRALLNLGHTVAHGLESLSNYRLSHGLAVGAGLRVEARLAALLGILPREEERWIQSTLAGWGFGSGLKAVDPKRLLPFLKLDKKARDGRIPFVFLERAGRVHGGEDGAVTHLEDGQTRTLMKAAFKEGF